ncbi:unnamed protein product, partial [Allacma fusca]
ALEMTDNISLIQDNRRVLMIGNDDEDGRFQREDSDFSTAYETEIQSVECRRIEYFFAGPIIWSLKFSNHSELVLPNDDKEYGMEFRGMPG